MDWQRQRPLSRARLQFMLGLEPLPERLPVAASCSGTLERPAYRIEKWVFQSLPGLYVTANFYLPHERPQPLPCIVYLNGHWPSLDGAKTGFQDRYLWYPANGFALLVIDPIGFGEIPGIHPGMNRLNGWHWLSLGYTPAGVEVWNAMRALDWLETRPEVDAARIGVTGISGGGVMTQYLAALDDRVAVAAPSCSTYTIGTQVALDLVPEQCDCTFFPNVFGLDFPEVLALIAPRPLLILGGRKDPIFPPASFRAAFQRARKIYALFAEQGRTGPLIRLVESDEGHTDPPHFLRDTRDWMCRWLREDEGSTPGGSCAAPTPEPPANLRCTERAPMAALNAHIHEVWIQRATPGAPTTPEAWTQRKAQLLNTLRSRIFAWFPRSAIPFNTRRRFVSGGYAGELAEFGEYEFDTEPGVPVTVGLLTPKGQRAPAPLVVWIKRAEDQVTFPDIDEFLPLLRTHAVAVLTPRFADRPLSGRDHARIERTAALLGRSIAALWVWDVLRTVAWVRDDRRIAGSEIAVYGRGSAGIVGLYAAVLDSTMGQVILRDPPRSHFDGPALPTILRDTDMDEIAGLLAPRRLSIINQRQDPWALTRAIYTVAGAPLALTHCRSLVGAIKF
ncbi:MAG: acetylxylan esterase [Candidatus Competibacter sp.]|nr:acetylxylan esterase [Candidatus Competibacter sp.]